MKIPQENIDRVKRYLAATKVPPELHDNLVAMSYVEFTKGAALGAQKMAQARQVQTAAEGMRAQFAAMAMQGLVASGVAIDNIVLSSVGYADALIAKLKETDSANQKAAQVQPPSQQGPSPVVAKPEGIAQAARASEPAPGSGESHA